MGDAGVLALGGVRGAWAVGLGACVALLSVGSSCSSRSGGDELPSNVPPPNGGSAGSGGSGGARIDAPPPPPVGAAGGEKSVVVTVSTGGKPIVVANTGGSGSVSGAGGAGGASGAGGAGSLCQPPALVAPGCVQALESESLVALCNGSDDDCDGSVDEGCKCEPGSVQPCFLGDPGRRHVGACVDGEQVCVRNGELETRWGDCKGRDPAKARGLRHPRQRLQRLRRRLRRLQADRFVPRPRRSEDPDGAAARGLPAARARLLHGRRQGLVLDGHRRPLRRFERELAELRAHRRERRDRDLHSQAERRLHRDDDGNPPRRLTLHVHVDRAHPGPGLRVEMCYPESSTQDLDLYLKQPGRRRRGSRVRRSSALRSINAAGRTARPTSAAAP